MPMISFRPYTKLKTFDWLLEAISLIIITLSWLYLLLNFVDIPETIPVHFNLYGEPDRFGDKSELLTVQYVGTALYVLLLVLGFFPQFHNIPATLSVVNTDEKRMYSARMLRSIKVIITLIFLVLSATSVYNALNGLQNQNPWLLFSLIGLLTAVIIYYWTKLAKK